MNFRVFLHAYSLRPHTYFRISCTKSIPKEANESIDVDKVGSKKRLASKSVSFRVELIASSFLDLISKQARLNPAASGFLLLHAVAT